MRKIILSFALLMLLLPFQRAGASPPESAPDSPPLSASAIISGINSYRAANGLPPYQKNSILMAIAQGQSDYQASIGQVTHTGPGGSRPIDRAYAAGYGDGQKIFVSEIIYGGLTATVDTAIAWWKTSPIHNSTMLASTYQEIGAGVATNGSATYYTAVTGWVTGYTAPQSSTVGDDTASGEGDDSGPAQTGLIIIPVVAASPQPDGSIVHTVRTGQALWNIAAVYETTVEDLLELNDLTQNALIFPGDEILVRPALTPTPSPSPTLVPPTSTPTRRPTRIMTVAAPAGTPISSITGNAGSGGSSGGAGEVQSTFLDPTVRWIVISALAILVVVLTASMFIQQKQQEPPPEDDIL